jgi:hypothetical protein
MTSKELERVLEKYDRFQYYIYSVGSTGAKLYPIHTLTSIKNLGCLL